MRQVWTIETDDANKHLLELVDATIEKRRVEPAAADTFRRALRTARLDPLLRDLLDAGVDLAVAQPTDRDVLSFFVECVAGVAYAGSSPTVGRLHHLRDALTPANRDALRLLDDFCAEAERTQRWRSPRMWFDLRVRCMDAYAAALVLTATTPVVYYAGSAHTTNLRDFLLAHGHAHALTDPPPLVDELFDVCAGANLQHLEVLALRATGAFLFLIGEHHHQTHLGFADRLLAFLQSHCDRTDLLFLIEKHISNRADPIQTELMCNQPDLAIHRSRCHPFLEGNAQCRNLRVRAVDNRHADLGFLRTEIFDPWHADRRFRHSARRFNRRVLDDVRSLCAQHR